MSSKKRRYIFDIITRHRFAQSLSCVRDLHSVHTAQIAANGTLVFLGMDNAVVSNSYSKRFWMGRFAYNVFLKWHTEYHRINTYMQGINLPLDIIYCRWHIFDVLWQTSKYFPNLYSRCIKPSFYETISLMYPTKVAYHWYIRVLHVCYKAFVINCFDLIYT